MFFGFVERMIGHVKTDVGKSGTKASECTIGTNETYKMIRYGWQNFLTDVSSSKPLVFKDVAASSERNTEEEYDDSIFHSIQESDFLCALKPSSEMSHASNGLSSSITNDHSAEVQPLHVNNNVNSCGRPEISVSNVLNATVESEGMNANRLALNTTGPTRRRRQRRSRRSKRARKADSC